MADRTRRGRSRALVGRRQPTNWSRVASGYFTVPAASKVLLATFGPSTAGIGETVRRTRGMISIRSDAIGVQETQRGAFGGIIVTEIAVVAGIVSLPSPLAEQDDDGWFLWVPFVQQTGRAVGEPGSNQYQFDSKGMRKVEEGYTGAFVVENGDPVFGLEIAIAISLLAGRE